MSGYRQKNYITAKSSNSAPTDKIDSTDPCLLPLAARRALFEKNFTRPAVKNNNIETVLHGLNQKTKERNKFLDQNNLASETPIGSSIGSSIGSTKRNNDIEENLQDLTQRTKDRNDFLEQNYLASEIPIGSSIGSNIRNSNIEVDLQGFTQTTKERNEFLEQNDLASKSPIGSTIRNNNIEEDLQGLIQRTRERNKFLEQMNLTIEPPMSSTIGSTSRNIDSKEALAAFKEIEKNRSKADISVLNITKEKDNLPEHENVNHAETSEDDLSDLNIYKEKDILSEDKNVEHVETYSNDSIILNKADISSTDEENCNQDYKNNLNYSSETDEKNSSFSDKNFDLQERNCPQESDANGSIGSDTSSLLSSVDENNTVISQSTKIYPELPQFDEIVYKTCSEKVEEPLKSIISPIKICDYPTVVVSPKKNVQNDPVKPKSSQATTPLRTLSMYRREQKIQQTLTKPADDEDEITTDLENEALKRDLLKKYHEEKSKKIENLRIEADKLNKIIYQSFRALDHCVQIKNISERIEAEKILLTNMVKKNACVDELYRLQKEENFDITDDPIGTVTFNKLMLLVKGNFFVSQVSGTDLCEYHFICLFTCGEKVFSTDALSSTHTIQEASLSFKNKIEFDKLRKDFRIRLTVYALALPKGKRNHDKKNIRLTPKHKSKVKYTHSPALKASPKSEKIKCNFKKMGQVDFTRDNIMRSRFSLENFMYESPLEDQIMVDLVIRGQYNIKFSSYLNFHETSGDYPVWNRRWCVLNGSSIYFWRFSEDEGDKQPMGVINLKHCVNPRISKATADISMRPNSFSFLTLERQNNSFIPTKHLMAADIRKERDGWLENLNKALEMIRLWEPDCLQPMDQASLDRLLK
ncbi:anillin [Tetranychus urticae]|uniref:PH domain-containing protein n=1 Tax=Tetranychus urticae TaxID=32264 RepID=T1KNV6_TETUR|nr:anillin [Tetranychus urticae]